MKLVSLDEFINIERELLLLFKGHWEQLRRADNDLPMCMGSDEWVVEYDDFISEYYSMRQLEDLQ